MSGWIKVEKDLLTDPRVLHMASRLGHADVTLESRSSSTIIAAIVKLWCFADTHARADCTLDCPPDAINQLVGVPNFCQLMPPEWLQVLDPNRVLLPNFWAHNGTLAKKRALNQKRQERHRAQRNAPVTHASRSKSTETTPDQDLDLDLRETPLSVPLGLDIPSWERWSAYRSKIRKAIKPASMASAQAKLAGYGADQAAVVEQSIANGWQGLFDLKQGTNGAQRRPHRKAPTADELEAEERAHATERP